MIHPIVRLIATEPQLLAEHVGAYASLINNAAHHVQRGWTMRILLSALALCCVGISAVLTGVALMLWAITPGLSTEAQWALGIAPALPAVIALIAGLVARRPAAERAFASIREQVAADLRMLSDVRAPS